MASSKSSSFNQEIRVANAFWHQIFVKLDSKNFLSWKQQVEGIICGHKLHRFLAYPTIPPWNLTEQDRNVYGLGTTRFFTINLTFVDTVKFSAPYVWEEIHNFFHSQMSAHSHQLQLELKSITNGDHKVKEILFLIVNTLMLFLMATLVECNPLVAIIKYYIEPCGILEVESMVLSHEAMIEKSKKGAQLISVNVSQAAPLQESPAFNESFDYNQLHDGCFGHSKGKGGRFSGRSHIFHKNSMMQVSAISVTLLGHTHPSLGPINGPTPLPLVLGMGRHNCHNPTGLGLLLGPIVFSFPFLLQLIMPTRNKLHIGSLKLFTSADCTNQTDSY
ncbi:hypothetical protein CR513_18288, partial [Mucuna pruriens]